MNVKCGFPLDEFVRANRIERDTRNDVIIVILNKNVFNRLGESLILKLPKRSSKELISPGSYHCLFIMQYYYNNNYEYSRTSL